MPEFFLIFNFIFFLNKILLGQFFATTLSRISIKAAAALIPCEKRNNTTFKVMLQL